MGKDEHDESSKVGRGETASELAHKHYPYYSCLGNVQGLSASIFGTAAPVLLLLCSAPPPPPLSQAVYITQQLMCTSSLQVFVVRSGALGQESMFVYTVVRQLVRMSSKRAGVEFMTQFFTRPRTLAPSPLPFPPLTHTPHTP